MGAAAGIPVAKFAIPALGAALGAATNRDNPLMGAVLGGVGGHFAGPMLGKMAGGLGGLGGTASQMPAALAAGNVSLPFASQASGLSGLGGLLGKIDPAKAMMQGGQMMLNQNQPQPMAAPPVPPPQAQFNRGSFQALGQGQNMYQPFNTRRG